MVTTAMLEDNPKGRLGRGALATSIGATDCARTCAADVCLAEDATYELTDIAFAPN